MTDLIGVVLSADDYVEDSDTKNMLAEFAADVNSVVVMTNGLLSAAAVAHDAFTMELESRESAR